MRAPYSLASIAVDFRVAEAVDLTQVVTAFVAEVDIPRPLTVRRCADVHIGVRQPPKPRRA